MLLAERVDLVPGQLAPLAGLQVAEPQLAHAEPQQPLDLVTDSLNHASDLPLAALADHEPASARSVRHAQHAGRTVLEFDALAQALERPLVERALPAPDAVLLLLAVARMRDPLGECAVVGDQQQPFGIHVEPADRVQSLARRDQAHDGRPAPVVAHGAEHAGRLVEQVGYPARLPHDGLVVDGDRVVRADGCAQLDALAVHPNAPGPDQLLCLAAAGDARGGQDLLYSLFAHAQEDSVL